MATINNNILYAGDFKGSGRNMMSTIRYNRLILTSFKCHSFFYVSFEMKDRHTAEGSN